MQVYTHKRNVITQVESILNVPLESGPSFQLAVSLAKRCPKGPHMMMTTFSLALQKVLLQLNEILNAGESVSLSGIDRVDDV